MTAAAEFHQAARRHLLRQLDGWLIVGFDIDVPDSDDGEDRSKTITLRLTAYRAASTGPASSLMRITRASSIVILELLARLAAAILAPRAFPDQAPRAPALAPIADTVVFFKCAGLIHSFSSQIVAMGTRVSSGPVVSSYTRRRTSVQPQPKGL